MSYGLNYIIISVLESSKGKKSWAATCRGWQPLFIQMINMECKLRLFIRTIIMDCNSYFYQCDSYGICQ